MTKPWYHALLRRIWGWSNQNAPMFCHPDNEIHFRHLRDEHSGFRRLRDENSGNEDDFTISNPVWFKTKIREFVVRFLEFQGVILIKHHTQSITIALYQLGVVLSISITIALSSLPICQLSNVSSSARRKLFPSFFQERSGLLGVFSSWRGPVSKSEGPK
jgi:hypothetical protein